MERKILHVKNCIAELLNYLLFIMVEIVLFRTFTKEEPSLIRMMAPLAVPLFYYLVRYKVHQFWIFALLHIIPLPIILMFYGDSAGQKFIFFLAALLQTIISVYIRINQGANPRGGDRGASAVPPIATVGLGMALYLIDGIRGTEEYSRIIMQIVMFFLVLYFIYLYLTNFLHYTEMSRRTNGNIPAKSIFTSDLALIGGFAGISTFLMITLGDRNFAKTLGNWIIGIFRSIFTFLFSLIDFSQVEEIPPVKESPPPEIEMLESAGADPNIIAQILDTLLTLFTAVMTLVFIVSLIYGAVMLIRRVFATQKGQPLAAEEESGDIVEKLERERKKKKAGSHFTLFKTPDEKIRKIFWNTLRKKYKKNPDSQWEILLQKGTARECLFLFAPEDADKALQLTNIYEKARYSRENCTEEDVKTAKELAGKL